MPLRRFFGKNKKSKSTSKRQSLSPFATRHTVEALENRLLLTTLYGSNRPVPFPNPNPNLPPIPVPLGYSGDTFDFQDVTGQFQRVTLRGNITAEVVGAEVDPLTNRVQLINLPGMLNNNAPLNGGILTPQGASVLGRIFITDPINGQNVGPAAVYCAGI